ncbi:MAG: MBL fold metallo-hydrolase [Candidatus Dormibacteria bacterium]
MDALLADGFWQIDTVLGGWAEVNSVFLIEADRPCLVETGPQRDLDQVLEGLARHGLSPDDLAWVVVTHIHLDHAGAVGEIAQHFPRAKIVCHPRGIRHLADPRRLIAASAQVYGERLDSLYGRMTAVDPDQLVAATDMGEIDLGRGKRLVLVDSPGHAKHHLGVLETHSGVLLVGDAVGVKLPGAGPLRPATPPDDFDLELAVGSLRRFLELRPQQLILTHYGSAGPPEEVLLEAEEKLRSWTTIAREAFRERPEIDHIEESLRLRLNSSGEGDPERGPAANTLNGLHSNAAGLFGWLERESRTQPEVS